MSTLRSFVIGLSLLTVGGCDRGAFRASTPDAASLGNAGGQPDSATFAIATGGSGVGGALGTGGAPGLGGVADPGGIVGSAGTTSSGGLPGTGGRTGTGGRGTGGKTGTGGRTGTGGALGTGGKQGMGGVRSTGGSTVASGGSGGGAGGTMVCNTRTIVAKEANNYAFSSNFKFPPVAVAARTNLTFDWSAVTADFLGHTVDPKKDLNTVLVFLWKLPLAELERKVDGDLLVMRDLVTLPLQFTANGLDTSAQLLSFSNTGQPTSEQIMSFFDPDVYPSDRYTYSLMVITGSVIGQGTRMIQTFTLSKDVTISTVSMDAGSTVLGWQVDIQKAEVTGIPVGTTNITLDWGSMTTNALGMAFDPPDAITRVLIGRYSDAVSSLERRFLDIERLASKLYEAPIEMDTQVNLSTLKTDASEAFPGIDENGTWLLALQCGACRNPAPWYLTVLKPCP